MFFNHSFACPHRIRREKTSGLHLPLEERFAQADAGEADIFCNKNDMKGENDGKYMICYLTFWNFYESI